MIRGTDMVNNLSDGLAWGISPSSSPPTGCRSAASACWPLCPAVWGWGSLPPGALSDRVGRKWLIAAVGSFWPWAARGAAAGIVADLAGLAANTQVHTWVRWVARRRGPTLEVAS